MRNERVMTCKTCDNEGVVCTCKQPSVWCDKRVCHAQSCPDCKGKSTVLVRDFAFAACSRAGQSVSRTEN